MARADARPPALVAEELAYLMGGAVRVAEVAVAALLAWGRLRVSSEGLLSVVHGGPEPAISPVQAAVLRSVGVRGRDAAVVLREVARAREVHLHLPDLKDRELVVRRPPRKQRKRLLVVPPPRTPRGQVAVQCAWHLAHGGAPAGLPVETLIDPALLAWAAGRVAVGGLGAYPDPDVAAILSAALTRAEAERRRSGDGCGSYACGSGCGGCGGGGCGGGCGGCGG